MSQPVRIGQIVGAHGLKGQLKILPLTDLIERFAKGTELRIGGRWYTVESSMVHKNRPLIKVNGIDTMDAAQALQWQYVEAVPAAIALKKDEYVTEELVGCRVVTVEGRELGSVTSVMRTAAHDILEVGEILIPAVKQFVRRVDLPSRTLTVELIPGMLPDEDDEE